MMTSPITHNRTLAALVIACVMAAFFAQPAAAQTAGNLECTKCVDTKDIAKKAIKRSRIAKGAVNESRLSPPLQEHISGRLPFYAVLDDNGSTKIIARNATFTVFARCRVNFFDPGPMEFRDMVQILVRSTVDGWFGVGGEFPDGTFTNGPFNAGDNVIFLQESVAPGDPSYGDDANEFTAAAPDGAFVAIDGEATGLGLNIFDHDCIAIGNVYFVRGTL